MLTCGEVDFPFNSSLYFSWDRTLPLYTLDSTPNAYNVTCAPITYKPMNEGRFDDINNIFVQEELCSFSVAPYMGLKLQVILIILITKRRTSVDTPPQISLLEEMMRLHQYNINMNTNLATTNQQSYGIKLTTRQTTATSDRIGYVNNHEKSDETIQETGWTLNNMLERYSFKDTYAWPSTFAPHHVIAKLRIPQDLIVNNITAAPFNSFMFWRGNVELQIQVTATPFHQGMAVAFFVPLTVATTIESNILPNFSSVSVNQCVYLFANANTAATLSIPFNSPQHYINLSQFQSLSPENALGYVYVVVFNRLQLAAAASDTATISIFSRFTNNQFKVPRMNAEALLDARPLIRGTAQSKHVTHHNAIARIADTLLPEVTVADAIDAVGDIVSTMLDKPIDTTTQNPNIILSNGRMNYTCGVEMLDKLTLDPSQIYTATSETFATDNDETSYDYLKKKYSYLGTFDITTTDLPGKVVASFPMNPFPSLLTAGSLAQIPLLSYISIPFAYYRGGFTYKIQFIATSLQTGKIFVAFNYGLYTTPPPIDINSITSQYGQAYEINQGSNTLEFSVPFVSTTPYKRVPTSNVPSEQDSLGYINIIILNSLVAPNNTPLTINCNVFIAGADDYEVNTLSSGNNITATNFLAVPGRRMRDEGFEIIGKAQSSVAPPMITDTSEVDMAEENLVAPNNSTHQRSAITQRAPLNIKDVLKKYQMFPSRRITTTFFVNGGIVSTLSLSELFGASDFSASPTSATDNVVNNLFQLYTPMFRMFKGGLRFKAMRSSNELNFGNLSVFYEPPVLNPTALTDALRVEHFKRSLYVHQGAPSNFNVSTTFSKFRHLTRLPVTFCNSIQKNLEFEIPFTSLYSAVLMRMGFISENFLAYSPLMNLGTLVIFNAGYDQISPAATDAIEWFVSLADESRLGVLYNVPTVVVNAAVDGSGIVTGTAYPDNYPTTSPNTNTLYRV